MILINGQLRPDNEQNVIIDGLYPILCQTLSEQKPPKAETVIAACDRLAARVLGGEFDDVVLPLLASFDITYERFAQMAALFTRDGLEAKCRAELPPDEERFEGLVRRRVPLGVLLHIAAGNVDGLPAYSVVEGLLAGNINLLKLPAGDSGISIRLLSELVWEEPSLAPYIYVFDVPSTETVTLTKLAAFSDAVVVWGGDTAVKAARSIADVTTKIIPWGHKLSFAYVTASAIDKELEALAAHICQTEQVLCSSCQGIFLDAESEEMLQTFGKRFFEILRRVSGERKPADYGMRAKNAIQLYNEALEKHRTGNTVLSGDGVSVIVSGDSELALSYMFRSVWVKRLSREHIVSGLKHHKNHLQTVAILCGEEERNSLLDAFLAVGVTRITGAGDMSDMRSGESHDGVLPLREYSRLVDIFQ